MTISRSVYNQLFEQQPAAAAGGQEKVIRLRPTEAKAGAVVVSAKSKIQMWTKEEHERFLVALEMFPAGPWKKVADFIGTKTPRQTMTHAQKYRQKIHRRQRGLRNQKKSGASPPASPAPLDTEQPAVKFEPKPMPSPYGVADLQLKQEAQANTDPAGNRLLNILAQQATTMQQTPPSQQPATVLLPTDAADAAAQVSPSSAALPSLAEILHLSGSNGAATAQPRPADCQCNCRCSAHGKQTPPLEETAPRPRPQHS
ncbi:hypothetical protein BBJ28_00004424 [Nothophytophthora sp. Chile5]|nr:hypothetical protein BBJ28_00004424 [Nothophytophthora sp. Chile5]